jgi:thiosulfate/3-mercaptopyruvate sulfurtransferase
MQEQLDFEQEYANDVLVSARWVADRLDEIQSDDPALRLVEVDLNSAFYEQGHIPGAIGFEWDSQLRHQHHRGVPSPATFADLLAEHGINNESTIIVYGDNSNWFAAYFYWLLSYFGHDDAYLLNGGREYWIESGRETETQKPLYSEHSYTAAGPFDDIRAYYEDIIRGIETDQPLVDVRLPEEYEGSLITPPGTDEWAQRGGHIPGAVNIVWSENLEANGLFKSRTELAELYRQHGVVNNRSVITYCRIGERSALTWFVLSELLGFRSVQNYDGSWTEWGSMIGTPIVKGSEEWTSIDAKSDTGSH